MFNIFTKKETSFLCPVDGNLIPLSMVNDPVFSQGMMGTGFAIIPSDGAIYAPMDGVITVAFPTGHAYGIKTKSGLEILLHIGIDTVELKGEGFHPHYHQEDVIHAMDKIADFDLNLIRNHGKDPICIILFPNKEETNFINDFTTVKHGTKLFG